MKKLLLFCLISFSFYGCRTAKIGVAGKNDVAITFLHLNDVYEISALEGGKAGGMARVATVRQELVAQNPNTVTVLAGDFLNPSLIGTLRYEGKSIKGRQMVEVMNEVGVDWVCFGNHEFDLDESDLQTRINESKFNWLSDNTWQNKNGQLEPFGKIVNGNKIPFPKTKILTFKNAAGISVKVGIFGLVIPSNKKEFVSYDDFFESAKKAFDELKPQCDFVVALTHLGKADDAKLAEMLPDLKLIMGGHDHDNMIQHIGQTILAKADANAKTVYIHQFVFHHKTHQVDLTSTLKHIDNTIKDDPEVGKTVEKWEGIMEASFKKMGLDKDAVVTKLSAPLDGREISNRNKQTNLGSIIAQSLSAAAKNPSDCAIFNSGSVRIDDQVSGEITTMDILRVLPFGGKIVEVKMKGRLLERTLETGLKNKGSGGYLQWDRIKHDEANNQWFIKGNLLDVNQEYTVVTSDFLFSGKETNLSFFNGKNPDVLQVIEADENDPNDLRNDVRKALIAFLKK